MGKYSRAELEQAFQLYWRTGAVGEDWDAWADLFAEDATYVEHVLGTMKGRETIRAWIKPIMEQFGELYTAYEWHTIDEEGGRAIVYMQNRRDHPSGKGTIDFPGITILEYAGDNKWKLEEDYWAVARGQETIAEYEQACKEHDPGHKKKRTRLNWGNGPAWTRGARSYAERPVK
jgi:ketosteroid isomerase-like protein